MGEGRPPSRLEAHRRPAPAHRSPCCCLSATAERDGRRVISVVMHSDDNETRHTDSIALLDYGFEALELLEGAA